MMGNTLIMVTFLCLDAGTGPGMVFFGMSLTKSASFICHKPSQTVLFEKWK